MQEKLRNLPALHHFLKDALVSRYGHKRVVWEARVVLENARKTILAGGAEPSPGDLLAQLSERLENGVVPVINGTGVVLHTNLGRAPWAAQAQKDALAAMSYAAVEVDARTGKRGRRGGSVEDRLCALVGSQAALIVNNCAAAVLLALRTFARNRPVLISRGELVEIGGGYRVPEVLEESGARMLEVGTTNKTHLRDYEKALSSPEGKNGLVLKVHQSNFRQEGFVSRPDTKSLVALGVDLIVDLGSGSLDATVETPTIQTLVEDGAPIVCFSGDKLLGGPQAGIVVGHRETIEAMRACPLYRAIRPDKVTLAGLSGTLDSWLTDTQVPIWEMMSFDEDSLKTIVAKWVAELSGFEGVSMVTVPGTVGGGSLPGEQHPSWALRLHGYPVEHLKQRLLKCRPAVYGVVKDNAYLIDARTVVPLRQEKALLVALKEVLKSFKATR